MALPVVLAQTTPGQSPGTTTPPKKKPTPPPTRRPPKRTTTAPAKGTSTADADERTYWESIKDSKNAADFQAYLRKYGEKSKFSDLAHNRLTEIETANKPVEAKPKTNSVVVADRPMVNPPPNQYGIEFVWIPPGTFQMGSPESEEDRRPGDEIQHSVTISRGYFLGKFEITQAQWLAVMGNNPSIFGECNLCPVENVSFNDVTGFLVKLNGLNDGYSYRLPTEAEWEYAARAGTTGPYAGNLDELAWYDANSDKKTHPVGKKRPNAWGLYDMHGNVWEWVQDWSGEYATGAQTDPKGPSSGTQRVLRGGSFNYWPPGLRSAYRSNYAPSLRHSALGFRIVCTSATPANNTTAIQPVAGTPWRSPQGIDFVYVPSGSFDMGSADGPGDEIPVHRVTISQGFYLGKTEVTQAQWKAVMGVNPSSNKGDNMPVQEVSWDDVMEFIRLLNSQSGGAIYRLPTEAEWEYACRAGTTGPYAGDLDAMAWYDANSDQKTHPVGQKQPSAWGLYDMHGNVLEWVQDWYGSYGEGAQADPKGAALGSGRVYRGGAFGFPATMLRSADRDYDKPDHRSYGIGFRLARTP
ncbi:MAG: formylglycine-generating enzyme family protein [Pyrinomonadaceae bacterium]